MNAALDWREFAPPQRIHDCDCRYCDQQGDVEPIDWPTLVRFTFNGVEYVTDRYLAVRADLAPVPDEYEGRVASSKAPSSFDVALTNAPADGLHFRWQVIKATEMTGWRLRLLDDDGDGRLVGVVTPDGEHIGWAVRAKRVSDDYYDSGFTRQYEESAR